MAGTGQEADARTLLGSLRAAILAICGLALVVLAGHRPAAGASSHRLDWPVTYANGLALVAATGVLPWLASPGRRGPARLAAAVCVVALTFSRSALAGLVVGLALLWAFRRGIRVRWIALAGAAAALLIGPLLWRGFSRPAPDPRDAGRILSVSGHGRKAKTAYLKTHKRDSQRAAFVAAQGAVLAKAKTALTVAQAAAAAAAAAAKSAQGAYDQCR